MKRSIFRHIQAITAWLFLAITMGFVATLYVWIFDTDPPVTFYDAGTRSEVYSPGDTVEVWFDFHKERDCPFDVVRWIVRPDKERVFLDWTSVTPLPLGNNRVVLAFDLPKDAPVGTWSYSASATYRCNPLRTIVVTTPVVKFKVM